MKSKKSIQSDEMKHKKSKAGESMSPTIGSFEQISAKFQEDPIEFKKQFTEPEKLSAKTRSKSSPTRSDRWDKIDYKGKTGIIFGKFFIK